MGYISSKREKAGKNKTFSALQSWLSNWHARLAGWKKKLAEKKKPFLLRVRKGLKGQASLFPFRPFLLA